MSDTKPCVLSTNEALEHRHQFCIKPTKEMLANCTPERFGWKCTADAVGGAITYLSALISNRTSVCSADCKAKGACVGQQIARESGKCEDPYGAEQTLYNYKDYTRTDVNFLTGRADEDGTLGIIPHAANEMGRVITNDSISKALTGEMPIKCKPAKLQCLKIDVDGDKNVTVFGGKNNKSSQNTGTIHIEENQLEKLRERGYVIEGMLNINDIEKNDINYDMFNDNIQDIYLIMISLLVIYITYKLIYKK